MQEIARKCHKELGGFDRALRNVAFFVLWHFGILRLESQMDFIDLSSCWMFPRSLSLAIVILVVASAKMGFL